MKATAAPISVLDYCQAMLNNKIIVNRDYQRDDKVWSSYVRSYFIESILLEYPIPKIYLYVKYDLKTKTSVKEIVDGQQRSQALRAFYENELRLSRRLETSELQGKKYKDLSEELQSVFLSYSLSVDEFSNVGEEEIRESFARMNANNISLNAEELRNARFQGEFKQFVIRMSKIFRETFVLRQLVSKRDVIRMADTKMIADIVSIIDDGFITTRPVEIDDLYDRYDEKFLHEELYSEYLINTINEWDAKQYWQYEELNSKHAFYSIVAALIEIMYPGVVTAKADPHQLLELSEIERAGISMNSLNDSVRAAKAKEIDEEEQRIAYPEFAAACMAKTNVNREKFVRFAYFLAALRGE